MRHLEKPTYNCPICNKSRRWADHTECSKQLQKQNASVKRRRNNKTMITKTSDAYFTELLKRIGE